MAKLPPNEKLEQLRREGKTRSSQRGRTKVLPEPKRAKPYLQGELFRAKLKPIGGAAEAGKRLMRKK